MPTFRSISQIAAIAISLVCLTACSKPKSSPTEHHRTAKAFPKPISGVMFDDFEYASASDPEFAKAGWRLLRGKVGGLGPPGGTFAKENVSFFKDSAHGSTVMQLRAATDGTGPGTTASGIHTLEKFFEGTYAARVRFYDEPIHGPKVDQINETFYTISGLAYPMEPNYSECDFEYLANAGWGGPEGPTMWITSWHTYNPDPWTMDKVSDSFSTSHANWHTLLIQVMEGHAKYFIDGKLVSDHDGKFYPRKPMSAAFNLWFIPEGFDSKNTTPREWIEQVDWVYYHCNERLDQQAVESQIAQFRRQGTTHLDTVK